jgi:5,10-methylenetetrahydromethanopterin reductase
MVSLAVQTRAWNNYEMPLKVDIRVPVGLPVLETAEFIAGCEAAEFSGVSVHDHQHSRRDVFLTLALAAERTKNLVLYPATTNPVTRHPMVLASLGHTLEELAPGRVRLTIGPGYLAVGNIGRRRASLETMRDAILTVRRLLRGERVTFNGVETQLRNVSDPPTPVYLTAAGPKMVELAEEVADGALLLVGLHPKAIAAAQRRLETGAQRSGRQLADFPIIYITPTTVADNSATARRWPQQCFRPGQPYLKYPSNSNLVWLRECGFDLADDFVPEQIPDAQAAEICDAFGLFGTAEECLARLKRAQADSGVCHGFIFPTHTQDGGYEMPQAEIDAFKNVIFPGINGPE